MSSGYPIWSLIDAWYACGESDDAVRADFDLSAGEWAEAKAYYAAHRIEIDALRTMGLDPMTMLVLPRMITSMLVIPVMALVFDLAGLLGMTTVMRGFGLAISFSIIANASAV